jgi:hypothetical protein
MDKMNLAFQPWTAILYLGGQRIAISGGPAFDYVGDIYLIPPTVDRGEQLLKELAGRADKRAPLLVFMPARGLSNKHYIGILRTFARH